MIDILDRPEVTRQLFHPRREYSIGFSTPEVRQINIPVEPDVNLGGRLYPAGVDDPAVLFFHGNGEIASDYDHIAPHFTQIGVSLFVVDYRGYGRSDGRPLATTLLSDAVKVYHSTPGILAENNLKPPKTFIMGRSLGSAAAIEIAVQAGAEINGLIIESGFSSTFDLLSTC